MLSLWGGNVERDDDDGRQKGVQATARRQRDDVKAATRQRRGNMDANAISYVATGGRGNKAIGKRITNTI